MRVQKYLAQSLVLILGFAFHDFHFTWADRVARSIASTCTVLNAACNLDFEVDEKVRAHPETAVDILIVADNSKNMAKGYDAFARRISTFFSQLRGLDWRICVITTDIEKDRGQALEITDGVKALGPQIANADRLLAKRLLDLPRGSDDVQAIHAMNLAINENDPDCFRKQAALAAIVISNEDEHATGGYEEFRANPRFVELSEDNHPSSLLKTVKNVFGSGKNFTVHSIVVREGDARCYRQQEAKSQVWFGTRYQEISEMTAGVVGDLCVSDYRPQITAIVRRIRSASYSVPIRCIPEEPVRIKPVDGTSGSVPVALVGNKLFFPGKYPMDRQFSLNYRCLAQR